MLIKEAFNADLFPTEQKVRLSENSAAWPETINSILIRKYPDIANFIDKITFSHLDKIKGNAIGYVTIINNLFRIPFVVDKFTLSPMDVYVKGNVYGHLSIDSVKRLCSNSWPFKQVSKQDFVQLKKFAAVSLTDISIKEFEANPELIKIAEELVEQFPEIMLALSANLQTGELLKHAGFDPYGVEKIASLEVNSTRTAIVLHHFGKSDESLSIGQVAERFGEEKVASVLHYGSVITPLRDVMVKVAETDNKNQFSFDVNLPRTVGLADGIGGYVRGNIYELRDIKSPNAKKGHIFLSTRAKEPSYTTIFTAPAKDRIFSMADRAILGDIVDDMTRPSGGKGQAVGILMNNVIYGPFEVITEAVNGSNHIISIKDGYEYDTKRIHMTNDVKTIIVEDDEIYVPNNIAKIIYLGTPYQMESPLSKTAAVNVTLAVSPDKSSFNLSDCGVSGLPSTSLQSMGKTKAVSALMHCGLSEDEAKAAVDHARTAGVHRFNATPTATQSESETRQEAASVDTKKTLEKKAETIRQIVDTSNLIKIAMNYGDEESVDMALGLKLVTPTSIKKYRILIPKIEDTLDGLCKLVMAKRVGGSIIPIEEGKITTAITGLSDVLTELTGI